MKKGWEIKRLGEIFTIKPPKSEARLKVNGNEMVSFVPMEDLGILTKDFLVDKESILELYKKDGYRDVMIYKDSIITIDSISKKIVIGIDEGKKYYFRNITWLGNSVYQTELLEKVLNIKKGDVYIEALLQDKIFGLDGVSSLYLDNGYLFLLLHQSIK